MGRVVSLQLKGEHWAPMEVMDEAVVTGVGIAGDKHAGREHGKRQILIIDESDLRELDLKPGDLREQLTVDLPGLMTMAPGTRLRAGEAVLELTGVCEPCTHIGEHLGAEDPEEMRRRLIGRRGMLARVIGEGLIRPDDPVVVTEGEGG